MIWKARAKLFMKIPKLFILQEYDGQVYLEKMSPRKPIYRVVISSYKWILYIGYETRQN